MYCPKCKQTFEEGSRRFCPSDGTRLVSETVHETAKESGGVFSHLISRMAADSSRDDSVEQRPVRPPHAAPPILTKTDETAFFEFEDNSIDFATDAADAVPITAPLSIPSDIGPAPSSQDAGNERAPITAPLTPPAGSGPQPSTPAARKVNPYTIPAGHVDLSNKRDEPDFSGNDPETFVGRVVKGRYAVTEFLGGDSNGLAYLGEDKIADDRKVLVRVLLDRDADEVMSSILAEERVALSHLSHPNIARLIDSGQFTGGPQFLITEYIDALSVRDVLEINGRFEESRAARVIRQVAYALSEAHQQGVLHRDIRPENIILDPSDEGVEIPKIVNFGASDGIPNPHNMLYRAPEVLDGRIATIASDIFSLAVVAFEMVTGRLPFQGATLKELSRSHNAGFRVPASALNPKLSPSIDSVFARAFASAEASRYPKARDFGDAFASASVEASPVIEQSEAKKIPVQAPPPEQKEPAATQEPRKRPVKPVAETIKLEPLGVIGAEPAWKGRSPEPPQTDSSWLTWVVAIALPLVIAVLIGGWIWMRRQPDQGFSPGAIAAANSNANEPTAPNSLDVPPLPRSIPQPANTNFYENSKQNLKGDLLLHYVGFSLFYPKDWKVNGPEPGANATTRGKFLDISRETPDGRVKEQMLISYYPSKGTFHEDADRFPELVKETNDTLKKLLPDYQMISEGEVKINGDWRAYEVKFQGGGTSANGEKLVVWGRRLFMPAARPGVRDGFEITMLATSLADNVHGVDDVGVRDELAAVLYSFEPGRNF